MSAKKEGAPAGRKVSRARLRGTATRAKRHPRYVLKLYVAGVDRKSVEAIRAITELCNEYLKGRYQLAIIDIYQQPTLAQEEQIIAAPTLIRKLPLPLRMLVGDMTERDRILVGLDLRPPS